ncbi:hypothetical protein EDEG_01239 [Edhazardia aedis USNM 41457]|uniref:SCP domain-containing protein n=1 Tax=Edhazardia aedis (strain USNM 41457) TaxID=1003232 RepID=J9DA09_EDHAE|nr:hypothetical protein EDEG_01239 [Edhazardia aedis USNM 41457]|eukprot:EJW04556.1 hypothetical protein EDEG_01239 [Edhazardia aedis USNM 41457]
MNAFFLIFSVFAESDPIEDAFKEINGMRKASKLPPLIRNANLDQAANIQALYEMKVKNITTDNDDPKYATADDRIRESNYADNFVYNELLLKSPNDFEGFVNVLNQESKNFRNNILSDVLKDVGIGTAADDQDRYWTFVFAAETKS